MTVLSDVEVWRAYEQLLARKRRSPETVHLYRVILHDLWGDLAVRDVAWWQVTPEAVDGWLERRCHPHKRSAGMALSRGSRSTYGRIIGRFYRRAAGRGWLQGGNPLEDWEPPPRPGRRPRALPVSAIGELLVELAEDQRLRMMVLLGYHQKLETEAVPA